MLRCDIQRNSGIWNIKRVEYVAYVRIFQIYVDEQRPESVRTFVLLRRLSEGKTLTPEETHELLENHYNMAGANVTAKIETQISRLDAQIQSMNAKHDALVESMNALKNSMERQHSTFLWVIGIATALLGAIQIFT